MPHKPIAGPLWGRHGVFMSGWYGGGGMTSEGVAGHIVTVRLFGYPSVIIGGMVLKE